jgi:hypothetical protein
MSSVVAKYISEANSIEEKKKIYSNFRTTGWIPKGEHNPPFWPYQHSRDEIEKWLKGEKEDFLEIKGLFGDEVPEEATEDYGKFLINSEHSLALSRLDSGELRKISLSEFFPHWGDFSGSMRNFLIVNRREINLENLLFDPKPVSRGGFGEIYPVSENGEVKYALKLFFPSFFFNPDYELNPRRFAMDKIKENVFRFSKGDDSFKNFFPDVKCLGRMRDSLETEWAYLMDYLPGRNLRDLAGNKKDTLSRDIVGKVLLNYANMLKEIHAKNYIYIDNSLSSILIDEKGDSKIVDIDFLTSVEKLDPQFNYPCHLESPYRECFTKEIPSISSDLESFSFMIHHLIFGTPFLKVGFSTRKRLKNFALKNERAYSSYFSDKLPKSLRELIPALVTYPRDDSVKAQDFVYAIGKDFFGV